MKKRIMIVDDNLDVIAMVKKGLERITDEYEIIGIDSGKKCLESLNDQIPDLILLDIMMPEMDGWETLDKLKRRVGPSARYYGKVSGKKFKTLLMREENGVRVWRVR